MRAGHRGLGAIALLATSCIGDDLTSSSGPRGDNLDAGFFVRDGEGDNECPGGPPKMGEACPPRFLEAITCSYELGECTMPDGTSSKRSEDYCCRDGIWLLCGGRTSCDVVETDAAVAPPVDVAPPSGERPAADMSIPPDQSREVAPIDLMAPAPDVAPDVTPDSAPDAGLDDAGPDNDAGSPADTGVDASSTTVDAAPPDDVAIDGGADGGASDDASGG